MGNYRYVTNRILRNTAGKENGNIAIRVLKESATADIRYTCPECRHKETIQQEWKRPFSTKCAKCGFLMRIARLKDELKKEKKKRRKT